MKKRVNNNLGDIINKNKYSVYRFAEAIGVAKDVAASWIAGKSQPSGKMMKYISGWLDEPVCNIWPQAETGTDWNIVYNAVSDRLDTVNYHQEPELFQSLCNKKAIASVKLYSAKRKAMIIEQDKRNGGHAQCLTPHDFARLTAMERNRNPFSSLFNK